MAVGQPTESEIQTMITNAVDILEKHRAHGDGTATAGGELDVLLQSLEGTYAPSVANAAANFRAQLSSAISAGQARAFLEPLFFEYGKFISENAAGGTSGTGVGAMSSDINDVMAAVYEHMRDNSLTVQSRTITYDTSATTSNGDGGAIVGTGGITRLTTDREAFALEACTIERKVFRCVQDQNTGAKEEAEVFEVWGEAPPIDEFGRNRADVVGQLGTGYLGTIRSLNAGSGSGGSLLRNSSFSTFTASASSGEQFNGWTETLTGTGADTTDLTQSTTVYRTFSGDSSNRSLSIAAPGASGATYILTQTLDDMRIARINPNTPYFFRVMYKGDGIINGTLKIRLGATEDTVTVSGSGWQELFIVADEQTWPHTFNQDGFGIDIEYVDGSAAGTLLIDDAIFAPYTLIDGTYWVLRGNAATHTPWKLGDTLEFTDTGGAPGTAEIQYWLYRSGLGYLPHVNGSETWTEPA